MAEYKQINGIRTWYDVQGEGDTLVMLHPGGVGVDSRAFGINLKNLITRFRVFLPERRGHGRTPDAPGAYSFELVADDTIAFIEEVVGPKPIRLLGMSDGAVVALLVALKRPDLVERLICVGGVFHHKGWLPGIIEPTEEPPGFLVESYGGISPDGKQHYRIIHQKLNQMHLDGPTLTIADLGKISCRTLIMVGDDDEVAPEHTQSFYRSVPKAELAILPGTSHGLLIEKPALSEAVLMDFLTNEAVQTLAPIRRAGN